MSRPAFLITIDTEGDNLWARPREITTHNARFLPRFQALCERYRLLPTWLTNHEMALCEVYREFARDLLARDAGEVGMHLHAWNSPPIVPLTPDDYAYQPFLVEYNTQLLEDKVAALTQLLESTFGCKMTSHRAGRWAMDSRYVSALIRHGYAVDCSVTPHISWRHARGAPQGRGGSDYTNAPEWPYLLGGKSVVVPGSGPLLEVPMTTRLAYPRIGRLVPRAVTHLTLLRPLARARLWLRPKPGNLDEMLSLVQRATMERWPYVQFMLHSSELMPGGSPTFRTDESIERLYADLEQLFEMAARHCVASTMADFGEVWRGATAAPHLSADS